MRCELDGWCLVFRHYDAEDERRREALFALGNGLMVVRAAQPWADAGAHHYPGTYRAGLYDALTSRIAGEQVVDESLVNLPNWLCLSWRVLGPAEAPGAWFRLREVELLDYRHRLDLAAGRTRRDLTVRDDRGRVTCLVEERLVSHAHPVLAAVRLTLTPQNWSGRIEVRSGIDGGVVNDNVPRYRDYAKRHLVEPVADLFPDGVLRVVARLAADAAPVAVAERTLIGGEPPEGGLEVKDDLARRSGARPARPGAPLVVEKTVAVAAAPDADPTGTAHRAAADAPRWPRLAEQSRAALARRWLDFRLSARNREVETALRFHVLHVLQTLSPFGAERDAGAPARGWHGEAYSGHIFWDEAFVLPMLTTHAPELVRAILLYRCRRLDQAREAARTCGYRGAMFPWRSAGSGHEATARHQLNLLDGRYMPDNTHLQRHVGAAVALSIVRYAEISGDRRFLEEHGAEVVLEVARFWASIAEPAPDGRHDIRGVLGPDEYHDAYPGTGKPGLDNNAYTNVMAAWTLRRAVAIWRDLGAEVRERLRHRLELRENEIGDWDAVSRRLRLCFHGDGVLSQFEGFDRLEPFDPAILPRRLRGKRLDWALAAIGDSTNAYQVTKQADALTLFHLLRHHERAELSEVMAADLGGACLARTARYYLARNTHQSSLSRIVAAGALAQVSPDASWTFFEQALATDLDPLEGEDAAEGIHFGAMAGTMDVLQRHYLGLDVVAGALSVHPRLPRKLGPVRLGLRVLSTHLDAEAAHGVVTLHHRAGSTIRVRTAAGEHVLSPGTSFSVPASPEAMSG